MMLSLARYFNCDVDDCMNKFLDTSPEPNCLHADPLAEEVYRDMDREDQKEFEDYGKAIHERKVKIAWVNLKRKMQTDMGGEAAKRSRGRGRGRGRGLEDEAGPSVEASAVASSSAPPPSAAPEAPAEQPFRGRRTFGRAPSD